MGKLAGREGFEPSIPDPKSGALPLGDRPSPNFYEKFIRPREKLNIQSFAFFRNSRQSICGLVPVGVPLSTFSYSAMILSSSIFRVSLLIG